MWTFKNRLTSFIKFTTLLVILIPAYSMAQDSPATSGRAEDNAYAAKVWRYMNENNLVGDGRMRSFPFVGSRPHGSIQEVITTDAEIDGQKGRLIVKHNYGSIDGLSPKTVYTASQDLNYEALTVMFKREAGYDTANHDWFWAEYKADGSVINYQGTDLSGRSSLCLACHTPLGGNDREILNGNRQ